MPIVRRSRKRDAILDLMRSTTCHPSADWVYQWMREQYPDARRLRLEVNRENVGAARLYEKTGYQKLDYDQMVLDLLP